MAQFTVEIVTIAAIALIGIILAVYLIVLKKNGWLGGNSKATNFYRCPNKECKGIFQKPIELKDLSETPARIYPACPECGADLNRFFGSNTRKMLKTKVRTPLLQEKPKKKPIEKKVEIKAVEVTNQTQSEGSKPPKSVQTKKLFTRGKKADVSGDCRCQYYFGYLADREKQEGIPDPCLECPRSLDCMLTNYKSENTVTEIGKWYSVTA